MCNMAAKAKKVRADRLMAEQGLAESREQAQVLIMEGLVFTRAGRVLKASSLLPAGVEIEVKGRLPYVGRGGVKLAHALDVFRLTVDGFVALDVGASTGGFTDCLLQRGAAKVYAVDVGHGQLDYRLRSDERVEVMEKVNARYPLEIPHGMDLAVIDVSFISLTLVIPNAVETLKSGSNIIALVKPQFEAHRDEAGKGGVIKDPQVHAKVLGRMVNWVVDQKLRLRDICPSPILGDAGNREFFMLLQKQ